MKVAGKAITLPVEKPSSGASMIDVLDHVLDKGIVIEAHVHVAVADIELITVERIDVIASQRHSRGNIEIRQLDRVDLPSSTRFAIDEAVCASYNKCWGSTVRGAGQRLFPPHRSAFSCQNCPRTRRFDLSGGIASSGGQIP